MLSEKEKKYWESIIKALQDTRKDIEECLNKIEKRERDDKYVRNDTRK